MNEQIAAAESRPWGSFQANGWQRCLRLFVAAGLSHGVVKKIVQRLWYLNGPAVPADIVHEGVRFRLHPWDNVKDRKILFGSARQDAMELNFLGNHLTDDGVFVDVGANIGYYSCLLARRGVRRIIAVEPHPRLLKRLSFHVYINDFADTIAIAPYALGDGEREVRLTETEGSLGASSVLPHSHTGNAYTVTMKPLLNLCREHHILAIDALKIDVEGFEDTVLVPFFEQAPKSLWPKALVIEHGHRKAWRHDLFGIFERGGYRSVEANDSNTMLSRV